MEDAKVHGKRYILVINPGSTSTKIAIFEGNLCLYKATLCHSLDYLKSFKRIYEQKDMRKDSILRWLEKNNIPLDELICVVGRGGLLRPMPGGTYLITEKILEDLETGYQGEHASNLGGIISFEIANMANIKGYIVDPVAVDEFDEVARISGLPEIMRRSLVHALNIKAVTRRVAKEKNLHFYNSSFVTAHLGGGISIAPIKNGRIIDVNNANEEGPFSPERTGGLPSGHLVNLCFSGKYTKEVLLKKIAGQGGLIAYLNTNDGREIEERINNGDKKAEFILNAMAYQISKEIGAMATVLFGSIDGIILTGGLAYNKRIINYIEKRVSFIAPIIVVPGEDEMISLNEGALRVINGEEKAKIYENEVQLDD